ncbi:hypothetical protein KJ633_01860 [bacterium]|nr:hypothetical protein [bacterium]MBU4134598.1 hypothetical protein [bacterium]
MAYRFSPKSNFKRRMPVRSFRDLGIYQTTEKISVEIMRNIIPRIPEESSLKKDLADCCMKIPHFIAEAHSRRFDEKAKAMKLLEEVLFLCNKVVVYLEQTRDIYSIEPPDADTHSGTGRQKTSTVKTGQTLEVQDASQSSPLDNGRTSTAQAPVERVVIDEIIKKYFYVRPKIFNFFKAWKRFANEDIKKESSAKKPDIGAGS